MRNWFQNNILIVILFLLIGCGGTYRGKPSEESKKTPTGKIDVEAYLFDAKLKQDGKPTSVRLFFFQTDSVIAIGGRGYLGKGALKGWLNDDSIHVYFPTTNEYLYESIAGLFSSFDCTGDLPPIKLMSLFSNLPNQVINDIEASVIQINDKEKRPKFQIKFIHCPWTIEITYDLKDDGYRIRNFIFDDGKKTSLKAKRREYKKSRVKASKFNVPLSADMLRIIP